MRIGLLSRRVAGIFAMTLGMAAPALAQDTPRFELSAGYQLLTVKSDIDETLSAGWYADLAGNLGRVFAVVFQVSGNYKTIEETETILGATTTVNVDLKVHEFMGGVRANARLKGVTPFAQFLVGGVNGSATVQGTVTGGGQTLFSTSTSDSSTDFGLQVGGGVNFLFSDRFGVRAAADYIRVFTEDSGVNAFRFAVGAVFPF